MLTEDYDLAQEIRATIQKEVATYTAALHRRIEALEGVIAKMAAEPRVEVINKIPEAPAPLVVPVVRDGVAKAASPAPPPWKEVRVVRDSDGNFAGLRRVE
jgi:hypothetical protein